MGDFIARADDFGRPQPLKSHLKNVAELCVRFLRDIGFENVGRVLGLLHDIGKYSLEFQAYIRSVCGLLHPGDPGYLEHAESMRGKIPHAGAGARYAYARVDAKFSTLRILASMPILYHHSFPDDLYSPDGTSPFQANIAKPYPDLMRIFDSIEPEIRKELDDLFASDVLNQESLRFCRSLAHLLPEEKGFFANLLLRFFYSALIDADRLDAAGRVPRDFSEWDVPAGRLEKYLAGFSKDSDLNCCRSAISDACLAFASHAPGIYRMTIPTGGGKTLAGLRFALNHAKKHGRKRIIYAAPFLSILEQNADVVRRALDDPDGLFLLESHSNLLPDETGENRSGKLSENWDSPIIYTTMVQILNAMFSGESRSARRFHLFADSVLILDEIQSLPLEMIHIFNHTLNFIAEKLHATVILCSATQPLFDLVPAEKGALRFSEPAEMVADVPALFRQLKRVQAHYVPGAQTVESIADFVRTRMAEDRRVLLVCNTKRQAFDLYHRLKDEPDCRVFHLSTNMCPAHRKASFEEIRKILLETDLPVIVVSTSLIEAGVDLSFACVIRLMTALDSIAQAAGRCNRNAETAFGNVFILDNPEPLSGGMGKCALATERTFEKYKDHPEEYDRNLLDLNLLKLYYHELYSMRPDEMGYNVSVAYDISETLLSLLGRNEKSFNAYNRKQGNSLRQPLLSGAYRTAGAHFHAIDDLSASGIVVPYGAEGLALIAEMNGTADPEIFNRLLRRAQQYSVGVTDRFLKSLREKNAVHPFRFVEGVLFLDETFYSVETGISDHEEAMQSLIL